jgi:hypothetical protein
MPESPEDAAAAANDTAEMMSESPAAAGDSLVSPCLFSLILLYTEMYS